MGIIKVNYVAAAAATTTVVAAASTTVVVVVVVIIIIISITDIVINFEEKQLLFTLCSLLPNNFEVNTLNDTNGYSLSHITYSKTSQWWELLE